MLKVDSLSWKHCISIADFHFDDLIVAALAPPTTNALSHLVCVCVCVCVGGGGGGGGLDSLNTHTP